MSDLLARGRRCERCRTNGRRRARARLRQRRAPCSRGALPGAGRPRRAGGDLDRPAREPEQETALIEDAAHSLRLALEREKAALAHQEAAALRRSRELQRGFLSRLSHELRTPLTAIRGYASSLMQPDVTWDGDSQQRFLDRIAAESARLGRLVDDLLDFSAIESGVMRLQRDWCDLRLVVEAAVSCLPIDQAAAVTVDCDPALPAVWADHDRLEQVFVNLLTNALRHNPPGTAVSVSVRERSSSTPPAALGSGGGPGGARRGGDNRRRRRNRLPRRARLRSLRHRPPPAVAELWRRPGAFDHAGDRRGARRPDRAGADRHRHHVPDPAAGRGGRGARGRW